MTLIASVRLGNVQVDLAKLARSVAQIMVVFGILAENQEVYAEVEDGYLKIYIENAIADGIH
jgi:hypothetical protein